MNPLKTHGNGEKGNFIADTVHSVPLPENSLIHSAFTMTDLADAYATKLPAYVTGGAEEVARIILSRPAPWFRGLMRIRDLVMRCFGVKTSAQLRQEAVSRGSDHIDFFRIITRTPDEIILGANDRHLDFRLSILLRPHASGQGREVVVSTVVHCHNWVGRTYITLINPFHTLVVRSFLVRAANQPCVYIDGV